MLVSRSLTCLALCLFLVGCGGGGDATTSDADTDLGASETLGPAESIDQAMAASAGENEPSGEQPEATSETETPAGDANAVALSPDNTKIQFIGTHNRENLDPRTCEFTDFSGTATVDGDGNLSAISVEIQTDSVSTFNPDLTAHLMNEEFLDVRTHPTITFETTSVETGNDGTTLIGNLTMMGTTKEVRIPADVSMTDGQLSLTGALKINRSEYGMDQNLDGVNDEVEIKVTVENAG